MDPQKERLKKELELNEKSFKARIISKEQYLKTKALIHKKISSVGKTPSMREIPPELVQRDLEVKVILPYWKMAAFVFALLLVLSVLTYGFRFKTPIKEEVKNDELVFLYSDACVDLCNSAEPIVRDVAQKSGIRFVKAKYVEPVTVPGYILLYNNSLKIGGIADQATFVNTFCQLTNNKNVCG